MIEWAEAEQRVLTACARLAPTSVKVNAALGLVLAAPVLAQESVPPFANTAMDGYALRAGDTTDPPVSLEVVGVLAAGNAPDMTVGAGQAVRIMTGAPIPEGADAIVMVERTRADDDGSRVTIEVEASPGDHIRPVGEDIRPGEEVFAAGTVLGPGHLGVLASLGQDQVGVYPRVRVGVLSTGDELVEGPGALLPGQIRDSNRPALLALVIQAGADPIDLGVVPDTPEAVRSALEAGLGTCDAVITTGGVSMGDFDYVKVVLDAMSPGAVTWMQVAIRPAKPLAFGVVGGRPVFGLPGNPVSSMVSFELFARPALRAMMGRPAPHRPRVMARAVHDLRRKPDGKVTFMRVAVERGRDGSCRVSSAGGQGSNLLAAMARADGLAILPDGNGVPAGDEVEVILLQD